jgi:Pyruvate/2-oxoacid:ferredoxin oxidoreductase delta subunit
VERDETAARERWYPVLDRDRCTDCGHCQQFCIFGVYATDAQGRVQVVQPDACKSGCPACARVCPQGAVLFPLHREPAIAGAPGHLMELDLFGRQLFYNRTQQPCPRCGLAARKDPRGGGPPCPVCGRSRDEQPSRRDALDSLIDDLDRLEARR